MPPVGLLLLFLDFGRNGQFVERHYQLLLGKRVELFFKALFRQRDDRAPFRIVDVPECGQYANMGSLRIEFARDRQGLARLYLHVRAMYQVTGQRARIGIVKIEKVFAEKRIGTLEVKNYNCDRRCASVAIGIYHFRRNQVTFKHDVFRRSAGAAVYQNKSHGT